jgi:hypothetical protein
MRLDLISVSAHYERLSVLITAGGAMAINLIGLSDKPRIRERFDDKLRPFHSISWARREYDNENLDIERNNGIAVGGLRNDDIANGKKAVSCSIGFSTQSDGHAGIRGDESQAAYRQGPCA